MKKQEKEQINNLVEYVHRLEYFYSVAMNGTIKEELNCFKEDIDAKKYKGIVVYPESVLWEPVQRPHHILRILGQMGYLCFFCVPNKDNAKLKIEKKYENVYTINKGEDLLPLIGSHKVVVLITYFLQKIYANFLPNATIWFDVLDRLDFLDLYNKYSMKIYSDLLKESDIVSYSASNLKEYVKSRKDAILLENAVNPEDFVINNNEVYPRDLQRILKNKKKIIGYYGAIEHWFDFNLIKRIDETNKYNIILIGRVNDSLKKEIRLMKFRNVFFLGIKPFNILKIYGSKFDVAMIPFKVNGLTNSVSPVKFFEYMALKIPVVSSKINEVKKYECDVVKLVDEKNIANTVDELIDSSFENRQFDRIVDENTWKKRVELVEWRF